MRKLAIIRDNTETTCPFGLTINTACLKVGDSVDQMHSLEDIEDDHIKKQVKTNNLKIAFQIHAPSKCKYAAHLFPKKPKFVDCDYGDTAAGLKNTAPFTSSPYYTQVFDGTGFGGLLTYPDNRQIDFPTTRNPYYGMGQWASKQYKSILRQALLQTILKR